MLIQQSRGFLDPRALYRGCTQDIGRHETGQMQTPTFWVQVFEGVHILKVEQGCLTLRAVRICSEGVATAWHAPCCRGLRSPVLDRRWRLMGHHCRRDLRTRNSSTAGLDSSQRSTHLLELEQPSDRV